MALHAAGVAAAREAGGDCMAHGVGGDRVSCNLLVDRGRRELAAVILCTDAHSTNTSRSFVSLGHGRKKPSAAGATCRPVSAGAAEAQYGRY